MKKIYLIVSLLVTSLFASAQVSLPYSYDFGGVWEESGLSILYSDPSCPSLDMMPSQQDITTETFWFVSDPFGLCNEPFRVYLMSPRFVNSTSDSVQVSFRYIVGNEQESSTETFVIGYCNADTYTSEADFVWLEDTVVCTNRDSWLSYQHNVPATAQYVAIAYISGRQWALKIDDLMIRADAEVVHTLTVNANEGGTVTVTTGGETTYGTTSVREGAEVSFTVTADPGCYISEYYEDGIRYYYDQTSFTRTFTMLSDHVIDVVFGHYSYTIQIAATEHGRIVPDGGESRTMTVPWDTTVGFRFYPDEGYHVSSVALTANNTTTYYTDLPDTITIANVRKNYTLQVDFALNDYVVTATAGVGGTITPSGNVNEQAFTSPQFLIEANPGYLIDTVLVDGEYVEPLDRESFYYTFHRILANHTISVTFVRQQYIVQYSHGPHGSLTVQGGVTVGMDSLQVYYEDTLFFHFDADEGYELSDLQLNGVSVGVANPYLLTHVTQDSRFHAVFAEKTFLVTVSTHGMGSVTPFQPAPTGYFDTLRLIVTPGNCSQTDSVLLDGVHTATTDTVLLTRLEGNHTVEAYFSQRYLIMDVLPCEHGTVTSSTNVTCGGTARLRIVPDHCYRFAHFYLDGVDRADLIYTINDTLWAYISSVREDHIVSADFERIPYIVTVRSTGAGTVTPGYVGSVGCDTTLTFEVIPDDCHYVSSITVNGADIDSIIRRSPCADSGFGDTLRFDLTQIEQNQTVEVEFRQFEFPLSLAADANGSLSVEGTLQLPCGTDTVITIIPDDCYEIASVRVDDEDVTSELDYNGTVATYTFTNLHIGHTLEATFAIRRHTVSVENAPHGSIMPGTDTVVVCGNDLGFVVVPDECYRVDSVWIDGVAVNNMEYRRNSNRQIGDTAIFALSQVTSDHVVSVSFKPIMYAMWAMAYEYNYGSVTFSEAGSTVACGTSVTMTMTPADCYSIDEVWDNSGRITDYEVDEDGIGTYQIPSVLKNINMLVFFTRDSVSVELAQPTQHGTISYTSDRYACGADVTLTYQAEDCYHLDSVWVGEEWIPASELSESEGAYTYTVSDIHSDLVLDAVFSIDSIHFVSFEGAELSVTDSVLVCGQNLTVFSVREDCQQLDSVRVNSTLYTVSEIDGSLLRMVGDTLFVHFENLHEDCTLAVFYSQIHYELTTQIVGNGQVSQPPYRIVDCGDSIAIAITPGDCQHFAYVTLNGSNYPMNNDSVLIVREMRSDMNFEFHFTSYQYEMTTQANALGSVEGVTGFVDCGTDLSYGFRPADCAMLDSVYLDGVCVNGQIMNDTLPTLFLDSVAHDHTIKAVFKYIPYQVEIATDSFRFVDATSVNRVECGHDFTVRITPDSCHNISEVVLDGNSVISELVEDETSYLLHLQDIRQDHYLEIIFSKYTYEVVTTLVDSEGQTLAESSSSIVCGRDTTLVVEAFSDCYSIDSVCLNGTRMELQPSYLLQGVSGDMVMAVYMHKKEYTVEVQQLEHFTMTEGYYRQTLYCGDTLRLGFAPDEGYYLSGLIVDDESVEVSDHLVFENIHDHHTVTVLTELHQYKVVTETNEWGTATPDSIVVGYGSEVRIRLEPRDCYEVRSVSVDGVDCFDSLRFYSDYAELTLSSLTSDKAVTADFGRIAYACTVSGSAGGTITPSSTTILCGDTLRVAMIPATCYHIASVQVNDENIPLEQLQQMGNEMYYRVNEVRSDYSIEVAFERNSYSVTVENQGAGTVVTTADRVACGDEFSFYVAPAACNRLQSVLLNGVDITARLTYRNNVNPWLSDTACYTVINITENQVVEVSYESDGERHIEVTFLSGASVLRHESVSVACGADTVLPVVFDCYTLDSVLVDGLQVQTGDSCRFTEVIADHTLQVEMHRTQYQIEAQSTPHGTLTPIGTTTVACGTDKTYQILPDAGYYIDSLIVDDALMASAAAYTFTDIRQNHTIRVVFAQNAYLVDVEVSGNGYVTPDDTIVAYGNSVHFDILPDDCHAIDSVVVDGVNRGVVTEFDFASMTTEHILHSYFSRLQYTVTAGVSENGRITLGSTEVTCGGEVTFTVSANECYVLDSVLVNGVNRGAIVSDTLRNVRQNQVIDAYFSPIVYQVLVADDMEHGSVAVTSSRVLCGDSVTLTVLPDACYSVDSVLVNGVNVGAVTVYTIYDIVENQNVRAYFSTIEYHVEVVADEHGSVTHSGMNVVLCGEDLAIVITPDDCYDIGVVRVDGRWANPMLHGDTLILSDISANHTVSASFDIRRYSQYTESNIGGSVTPAFISAPCGGDVTYVIDPIDCYRVDSVWVNGILLPQDSLTFDAYNTIFTLHNIRQQNRLKIKFTGIVYQFDVESNGDGIVYLENSANCSGAATFYIVPAVCDSIRSAVLNDVDITNQLSYHQNVDPLKPDTAFYTISSMNADQLLRINYGRLSENHVSITYTDGTDELYAADSVLACGETLSIPIGYDCHTVDSVLVNGENVGAVSSLVLSSNQADQTVRAFFSQNRYTVASEVTEGGRIEPDGTTEVLCNESLTCAITPEACYSIDSVVVNGVNRGVITSYLFENITENQNIKAYFSKDEFEIVIREEGNGQILLEGSSTVLCGETRICTITPAECNSLDSVVVNGVNNGAVASYTFENISENQIIIAYFSQNEHQFVSSAGNGGRIEPSGTMTVACGSQQTYTILPDECYIIDSVIVNDENRGAISTCSLYCTDSLGNQTIRAFFSQKSYNVNMVAGDGGAIAPVGDTVVLCGESLAVTITPDDCHDIVSIFVDGLDRGAVDYYLFENVRETHTVSAVFVRKDFVLTPLASTGGSITPNVTVSVPCDSSYTFNFEPNTGYFISAVIVDGDTLEAANYYRFENITGNHTVKPLFARNRYEITAMAGVGGSVSPDIAVVEYGGRQTITITADDCYHIDSVFADGSYVGAYPTHTFNNVTEPHTLSATFVRNDYEITASVEGEGTISPVGTTTVLCGDNATYSFAPATGWHLTEVRVDDEPVEATDTYTFTDVRGSHTITAQFSINEYSVTATAGDGGSVTPAVSEASYGEDVTISINAAACYHIDSVFADGAYVGAVESYTFENVTADHTLSATFARNDYEITASVEGNGTISPVGTTTVLCGDNATYSFAPAAGWHLTGLLVDGEAVDSTSTYTFTDVRGNHTITAQFVLNEYRVTATAGDGGRVTPSDTTVNYGSDVTIEITAVDCYRIDSVFADGVYVGAVGSYTFSGIDGAHTLTATFVRNGYEITASIEGNGTISPSGTTTALCGDNATYSFAPATGWHLTGLLVDDESVDSTSTYTFTDVRGNHTITAQFVLNEYRVMATAGEGGSVTPSDTTVNYGSDVTIGITAADCYRIDSVFADGVYVGSVGSYTFSGIDGDHTLTATFVRNGYEITATVEGNGTISPVGTTTVLCGDNATYSFAPATGWHLTEVRVDGEPVEATDSYTFTDVRGSHTITAQFVLNEYRVMAMAGDGGRVTPSDTIVNYGSDVTIGITAADCYRIDSVFADGVYVGLVDSYTFSGIDSDHTLTATFVQNGYEITASVEGNGTISPVGTMTVNCGESITYTITPADGWHLAALQVDGASSPLAYSHTFENIRANHTIVARFAINEFEITATAGTGGVVSPSLVEASYGDTVTIEVTADDCYHIDSVFVDDVYVGGISSYTFENVESNHTLTATFAMNEYTISVFPVPQYGTITPSNMTLVNCGDSIRYDIRPEEGYHIAELIVDRVSVEPAETYVFSNVRANHLITAQFAINEYHVTTTAGEGGIVTPSDTTVNYGSDVTIEITAADCYSIDSVFADGVYVGSIGRYTFSSIDGDHTLTATFVRNEYTVEVVTPEHGRVTIDTDRVVCGNAVELTVVSDICYHIDSVVVNGTNVGAVTSYQIENIHTDQIVAAYFSERTYQLSLSADEGGHVTPTGDTTVICGSDLNVEIIPDECYDIENVTIDGVVVGAVSSYAFENVEEAHTLSATFVLREYTLTPVASDGGTIVPDVATTVPCGSDFTFRFTPNDGYYVSGVVLDGDTLAAADTLLLTDITTNHSIQPLFSLAQCVITSTAGEGGRVTPTDTTVNYGSDVTIEITAEDCYRIDSVIVNGENVGAVTSYEILNISENQEIEAFFTQLSYNVFVSVANEDEGLFFDTIHNLPCSTDTLVTIPLFDCYHVDSIAVNGIRMENVEEIRIENIHESKNIVFYLSRDQFVVVATKEGNGTINPSDTIYTPCDAQVTVSFTPDEGWYVENLIVDGESLGTPTSGDYTFYNIHENHTIEVIFSPNVYIITSSIDPIDAGHITPYGQIEVTYGADQTFNIEPFPGYQVVDVEVDGVSQGAVTTYTFHHVEANHTIVAHLQVVGVEEATANEEISVWPNPVENVCHIQLPGIHSVEIQLFDAQGKLLLRKYAEADEVEIDLSQRPSGMYLLRIVSDGNVIITKKVIRK